jgi:hypothetical protein
VGIDYAIAASLLQAKREGVDFNRACTVGRQTLLVGEWRLRWLLRHHADLFTDEDLQRFIVDLREHPGEAEAFLRLLGARSVASVDASPYEGASIIHDLNDPVPEEMHQRFSVVVDGGVIEHLFNVPVAIANYMNMVKVGGHLIIVTVMNNYAGHGFYQLSPEFFFRALSPENGFEVEHVTMTESDLAFVRGLPVTKTGPRYAIADPARAGSRVLLQNTRPVLVTAQARRLSAMEPFKAPPQQSDYVATWARGEGGGTSVQRAATSTRALAARLPTSVRRAIKLDLIPLAVSLAGPLVWRKEARTRSVRNREHYRRIARR